MSVNKEQRELSKAKEIHRIEEYYAHPVVSQAIARFCGADHLSPDFRLNDPNNKLADWSCEYVAIANENIAHEKADRGKDSPARSIKNKDLTTTLKQQPNSEIFMSFWQKELENNLPSRALFVIDLEYYNKNSPDRFLIDQLGVFNLIEPAYQLICQKLRQYGFNFNTVMTGKGYHFLSQISNQSPILEKIISLGAKVDPALRGLQESIPSNSKRDRAVTLASQQAHQGMGRLVQFFVSQLINEVRRNSQIPIEISDLGTEGIALDLTPNLVRSVETGMIGVPGSLYLKPQYSSNIYNQHGTVDHTRILTRVYRESAGQEIESLPQLILTRQNYNLAINNLQQANANIPESEKGLAKLIRDYQNSELYQFHQALDDNPGDHWTEWAQTYRNYAGIAGNNERLQRILAPGSHDLLEPGNLNYILNHLFDHWGANDNLAVAGHIRSFLRSAYEDPRFAWGDRFIRHYSATQHAEGWATIILGQRFDQK
ncbi:MAG: hypothetical protein GX559_03810 [Candidatus Pacebacteria bacterium]|nr:hypothetical protein [Candidatus Paceibacterota bacterium]